MHEQSQTDRAGVLSFENTNRSLPSAEQGPDDAGTWMGHTAFAVVLPFLEQGNINDLYVYEKRLWDVANEPATGNSVPAYVCPSGDASGRKMDASTAAAHLNKVHSRSNYVVCRGNDTKWILASGQNVSDTNGAFLSVRGRKLNEFIDGTSHTIITSEVIAGRSDVWPQTDYRGMWSRPNMGCSSYTHRYGPNTTIGDHVDPPYLCFESSLMPCNTSHPTVAHSPESARSQHPGGVKAVSCDGHVDFYNNDIDLNVWKALVTIAGND